MSPGQLDKLRRYEGLLSDYSGRLGLLSPLDADRIWTRHVLDSLRALRCLTPSDQTLVDIGSGAGLPGVPVAIARPDASVLLIEPMRRRVGFLELVVDRLALPNVRVLASRAPQVGLEADLAMARALADPRTVWELARSAIHPTGRVLYFAGRSWSADDARAVSAAGAIVSVCLDASVSWEGPLVMMRASEGGLGTSDG